MLFIPIDVYVVVLPRKPLCFHTGSTTSPPPQNQVRFILALRHLIFKAQPNFLGTNHSWEAGAYTTSPVFTCKPISLTYSATTAQVHKVLCHFMTAKPRFNMLTVHILYLLKQSTQSKILNAWLGLKRYHPSTILSQLPQKQADPGIRLTWVHACMRACEF